MSTYLGDRVADGARITFRRNIDMVDMRDSTYFIDHAIETGIRAMYAKKVIAERTLRAKFIVVDDWVEGATNEPTDNFTWRTEMTATPNWHYATLLDFPGWACPQIPTT